MTDYGSSPCSYGVPTRKHRCPVNGKEYAAISRTTIKHHIHEPWKWDGKEQVYYFCSDPECNVVYFGEDDTVIDKSALRTSVGIKEQSGQALVCYCFGVTMNEAARNPDAKAFVVQETKGQTCACEVRNPSGRCCLKDFPKA
jgi:hypothetical protein